MKSIYDAFFLGILRTNGIPGVEQNIPRFALLIKYRTYYFTHITFTYIKLLNIFKNYPGVENKLLSVQTAMSHAATS